MRPVDRFYSHVSKTDGCWTWTGCVMRRGYGRIYWRGKVRGAHRVAVEIATGVEPDAHLYVCHRCDNPRCVRPDHLFVGTPSDNAQDQLRKGRHVNASKTHCVNGHALTADNVWRLRGSRVCKACTTARKVQRRARLALERTA